MIWLLIGLVFILSAAMTGGLRRYALKRALLDIPNARSSHTVPTPRGGGLAIVVVTLLALPLFWLADAVGFSVVAALWVGGVLVAGIGGLDDLGHVPARWRMLVHVLAAVVVVAFVGSLPPLDFAGVVLQPGYLGLLAAVLFIVWTLNLYNFMDGIDGIAGVEAVTVCLGMAGLLYLAGEWELAALVLVYGAAALGFLAWNWPPAKIFMGDAGSGFLGFSLAALAVACWAEAAFPIWAWLIMLGVFIVDATVTLIRRVLRGERFYEAHRSHAYQYASRRYQSHLVVTLATGALNLFWLLPWAWLSLVFPEYGFVILAAAWGPLVVLALRFHAGLPEPVRAEAGLPNGHGT